MRNYAQTYPCSNTDQDWHKCTLPAQSTEYISEYNHATMKNCLKSGWKGGSGEVKIDAQKALDEFKCEITAITVWKKNSFKLFKLTKFHSNMFVWPYFPPLVPCCVFFLYIDSHCNKWCLFVFNIVQLRPIFLYAFWCNSECEGVVVHVVKNTLGVVGLPTWPFLFVKCVIKNLWC